MFTVSVSIDALAVGLSFSLQGLSIWVPSLYFFAGTLIFTFIGLNMGNKVGQRFGKESSDSRRIGVNLDWLEDNNYSSIWIN